MMRELWLRAVANGEVLVIGTVHLIAGAFILAWLAGVIAKGVRNYRIIQASREAERQLKALTASRAKALRNSVVSETKGKKAA